MINSCIEDFTEEHILKTLLDLSPEFIKFYKSERRLITSPIHWVQDINLPVGIDFRVSLHRSTNEWTIHLRQVPAQVENAFDIAHELSHILLIKKGFNGIGTKEKLYEELAAALNSMVADPLLNEYIKKYGFDLKKPYETEIKKTKQQANNMHAQPNNTLSRIYWAINYVGLLLEWEVAYNSIGSNLFKSWFSSKYPEISRKGNYLLKRVKIIGFDSPQKQNLLFSEIIKLYKLENKLIIR